jgi:hypothetical protein
MNLARSLALSITSLCLALTVSACCGKGKKEAVDSVEPASGAAAPSAAAAAGKKVSIGQGGVSLMSPPGWNVERKGDWTLFITPPVNNDSDAVIAFVTFDRPGESTSRIGQIANVLDINNIKWGGRVTDTLKGSGFPASGAEGTCKDGAGQPCKITYLTINPGSSEQILFVYAVDEKSADKRDDEVSACIKSMHKGG